jgi:hypothetical protein
MQLSSLRGQEVDLHYRGTEVTQGGGARVAKVVSEGFLEEVMPELGVGGWEEGPVCAKAQVCVCEREREIWGTERNLSQEKPQRWDRKLLR